MEYSYKIESDEVGERFVFNSGEGDGTIVKVVKFDLVDREDNLYNLSMGDTDKDPWQRTSNLDFKIMSNNGDVFKVFNTVAICIELFLEKYPEAVILFTGSTDKRTKIYLKLISRNWVLLHQMFDIKGINQDNFEDFEPGKNYIGIVFVKKILY